MVDSIIDHVQLMRRTCTSIARLTLHLFIEYHRDDVCNVRNLQRSQAKHQSRKGVY